MKKLSLLLLFLFGFIATSHATNLQGTLQNPDGSGFNGTLYLSIAQQVGISSLGSCGGPVLVVPETQVVITIKNGIMSAVQGGVTTSTPFVYGGDCTLPAGMPYNAVLRDPNGNTMFSTMWLITGTTQDVGTIYGGSQPIPPTALTIVPGVGLPTGLKCSANSMYLQTDASSGAYLFPCVDGVYVAQGGGGGTGSFAIGSAITGATANGVLFVDGSGNLGQDTSNFNYNSTTHTLTVAQPIVAGITGNANTATSFFSLPSSCTGSQVAYGVDVHGNALCKDLTYADIGSPPGSFPVSSVFSRTGAITAQTGDYSFSQISGTISAGQLSGSGAIVGPLPAGIVYSDGTNLLNWGVTGTGNVVALSTSPVFVTPTLGAALATSINGTPIQANAILMDTTTMLLAAQMPALTGDVTNTAGTLATTVGGLKGVPFCTGFTPTAGQMIIYTTSNTPNPCYAAVTAPVAIALQTNGVDNGKQDKLNLVNGPNILITQDNLGNVHIGCPDCVKVVPDGVSKGVDWVPSTVTTMDDEFTSSPFNQNNIWTIVNQGSATVSNISSNLVIAAPAHSGDSFVGVYQAEPSRPFAVEAKIQLTGESANAYYGGLAFRDSGTGAVVTFRVVNGNTLKVDHWSGPTGSPSNVFSVVLDRQPDYLEVKDDGTNFTFYMSSAGAGMLQVYQEGRGAYLSSADQVGYIAGSASASSGMLLESDWFRRVL